MTRDQKLAAIIEREFRVATQLSPRTPVAAFFSDTEETITVVSGEEESLYVMRIGSDDDEFRFELQSPESSRGRITGRVIRFDCPPDWFEVSEEE